MGQNFSFDARAIPPASVDGGSEQLPVSDHLGHIVCIVSDEVIDVKNSPKDNNGVALNKFLAFRLVIQDGPHKGAAGIYRLNLWNTEPKAVEIAAKQMSALCHATGKFGFNNTSELYNVPFRVVVEQQADPKYTQIKGVLTMQGLDPGNPNAGPRQASAASAAAPAPVQTFAPPATAAPAPFAAPAAAPAPAWTPPGTTAAPATAAPPWGKS